jgi:2-dehydro-3-deoxyphosphogluconate aldolase/(4S)-4-hydroxy-2-oxoglutarate aldolase
MAGTLNSHTLMDRVSSLGVIPVVTTGDTAAADTISAALHAAGLPIAEVTFRTERAVEVLRRFAQNTEMIVGAGTVLSPNQVDQACEAGARFVVTPGFSSSVIERCHHLRVPVIPGVATPTDIISALDRGIQVMKFFPAEASGGLRTLRALHAPFPHVRFVPTGGITAGNAATYLAEPFVAAVGGSWMIPPGPLRAGAIDAITAAAREAVAIVSHARA